MYEMSTGIETCYIPVVYIAIIVLPVFNLDPLAHWGMGVGFLP